jgi:hypothetical protein
MHGVKDARTSERPYDYICLLLNFLLNPERPIKPEPSRSMVAGSEMVKGRIF